MSLSHQSNSNSYFKKVFSQQGFTMPIVAIFILAFLVAPLGFWLYNSKSFASKQVEGAETANLNDGLYIKVVSSKGSWDLSEYLCKTKEECSSALTSGKKWESVSGGMTEGSSKHLSYTDSMNGYGYIKVFVKPGWGTVDTGTFSLVRQNLPPTASVIVLEKINAVIIPVSLIQSAGFSQIIFSDKL